MTTTLATTRVLKTTTSRCPVCRKACPAEVVQDSAEPPRVWMRRQCPEHGDYAAVIASDARFYWVSVGSTGACGPGNGGCCSAAGESRGTLGRNAAGRGERPFEKLSTCLALIEIVNSCNLRCPTCYADSPRGEHGHVDAVPLADLQRRIEGVIARKGKIEILQLSGGEPTLHPELFTLIAWAQTHAHIDYVVLNTNGVRIAHDDAFAEGLAQVARQKKLQLYLQFDGVGQAGQQWLRGADLRATRLAAIDRCAAMMLPVTLAMTVIPENLPEVGNAIRFGLERRNVHGITFQPMFGSGRTPGARAEALPRVAPASKLNAADVLRAALDQSEGLLQARDFTPLPCGDPNCAIVGYLIRSGDGVHAVGDFLDFAALQGFLKDRLRYSLDDLVKCGCDVEPLGQVLRELEIGVHDTFRIMVKPFMDAWTWDQDRIDRCCTHVIRPDGQLDSFCRYYAGFPEERAAP